MRSARMLGLVLVAAMPLVGCGEAVGPPEGEGLGGKDLAVHVPRPRQLSDPGRGEFRNEPLPRSWLGANVTDGTDGEQSMITDYGVVTYFTGSKLTYSYWLVLFGNGYDITPTISISSATAPTQTVQGNGMSDVFGPIPMPWLAQDTHPYQATSACGLTANVTVGFRAFTGLDLEGFKFSSETRRGATDIAVQESCAPPSGGGGGGGGEVISRRSGLKICYYEVQTDLDGNVISMTLINCESLPKYAT